MTIREARERFYVSDRDLKWKDRDNCPSWVNARVANKIAGKETLNGYISVGVTLRGVRKFFYAHRISFLITYGHWPLGIIDHIDGNRTNNDPTNLRDVTHSQNMRNAKVYAPNVSGHPGVRWSQNRWVVRIGVDGERIHVGTFTNVKDAIQARKDAEVEYWGQEQVLRYA